MKQVRTFIFTGEPSEPDKAPARETTWRQLRESRANPRGLAKGHKHRSALYNAALEQSQQLFSAAASLDYAVRPIALFYGLSQGARALYAAHSVGDYHMQSGHGIKVTNMNTHPQIEDLRMACTQRGEFVSIARLTGSEIWQADTTLAEVWATIPELRLRPIGGTAPAKVLSMLGPDKLTGNISLLGADVDPSWDESTLSAYLDAHYPCLQGHQQAPGRVPISTHESGGTNIARVIGDESRQRVEYAATISRGAFAFPALGGAPRSTNSLLSWWALLLALSMRARYDPESWLRDLDVDRPKSRATLLEEALDVAIDVLPALLFRVLDTGTAPLPQAQP